MIYALGGFWLSLVLVLASGLVPYAFVLGAVARVAPPSACRALAWAARAGILGCVAVMVAGVAGTSESLAAMSAASALVDARTGAALWAAGALGACVPAIVGFALGGGLALSLTRTVEVLAATELRRLTTAAR